jgi:hypothetical protein
MGKTSAKASSSTRSKVKETALSANSMISKGKITEVHKSQNSATNA